MKYSSAAKKLIPKLRKLWDNDDYVKGIIILLKFLILLICHIIWVKK